MTTKKSHFIYMEFPFSGDIYTAEYVHFQKFAPDNSEIDRYTIINNVIVFKEKEKFQFQTWKKTFKAIPLEKFSEVAGYSNTR